MPWILLTEERAQSFVDGTHSVLESLDVERRLGQPVDHHRTTRVPGPVNDSSHKVTVQDGFERADKVHRTFAKAAERFAAGRESTQMSLEPDMPKLVARRQSQKRTPRPCQPIPLTAKVDRRLPVSGSCIDRPRSREVLHNDIASGRSRHSPPPHTGGSSVLNILLEQLD